MNKNTQPKQKPAKTEQKPELQQELERKQKELGNYIETLKRLQAEFENYKKYIEKEKANFALYAKKDILLGLLNITDDFERALKNLDQGSEEFKGLSMIYSNLKKLLQQNGVNEIAALNQAFDPHKHEVIGFIDGEENRILEEAQKGYMINDKVLRYSKVIIGKNNQNEGVQNEKSIDNK